MERRVNDAAKVTSNQASIVTIVLLLKANKYNNYLNLNLLTGIRTTAVPTKVQVGFFYLKRNLPLKTSPGFATIDNATSKNTKKVAPWSQNS